ncbi:hypothetical protein GCM10029992_59060 [Glycomyces albus]
MPTIPRPQHTRPFPLADLADLIPDAAGSALSATGVSLASNLVEPGDLYAALPGARRHGAEFAAQAAERGAVAVLTDARGAAMLSGASGAAAGDRLPVLVVDDPRSVTGEAAARVWGRPRSGSI